MGLRINQSWLLSVIWCPMRVWMTTSARRRIEPTRIERLAFRRATMEKTIVANASTATISATTSWAPDPGLAMILGHEFTGDDGLGEDRQEGDR